MRKLPVVLLAFPLGELSPKVTERAHAVSLVAKVSGAMRKLPATAKSRPLGEGGLTRSGKTEGVLPLRGIWHRPGEVVLWDGAFGMAGKFSSIAIFKNSAY